MLSATSWTYVEPQVILLRAVILYRTLYERMHKQCFTYRLEKSDFSDFNQRYGRRFRLFWPFPTAFYWVLLWKCYFYKSMDIDHYMFIVIQHGCNPSKASHKYICWFCPSPSVWWAPPSDGCLQYGWNTSPMTGSAWLIIIIIVVYLCTIIGPVSHNFIPTC